MVPATAVFPVAVFVPAATVVAAAVVVFAAVVVPVVVVVPAAVFVPAAVVVEIWLKRKNAGPRSSKIRFGELQPENGPKSPLCTGTGIFAGPGHAVQVAPVPSCIAGTVLLIVDWKKCRTGLEASSWWRRSLWLSTSSSEATVKERGETPAEKDGAAHASSQ